MVFRFKLMHLAPCLILATLLMGMSTGSTYAHDSQPPQVLSTVPQDGAMGVPDSTAVYLFVFDPHPYASGVDIDSVMLELDDSSVMLEKYYYNSGVYGVYHTVGVFAPGWHDGRILAMDFAGNCMPPYEFSFHVETDPPDDAMPPWAFAPWPEPGTEDIDPETDIVVYVTDDYSRGAHPGCSGLDIDSVGLRINGTEVNFELVNYDWFWMVVGLPAEPLPDDASITVELVACDLARNCMEPFSWSFKTQDIETEPPCLTFTEPLDGSENVSIATTITAVISDDKSGVDPVSIMIYLNGERITEFTRTAAGLDYRLEFEPPDLLPLDDQITIEIHACDLAGNCSILTFSFHTSPLNNAPQPLYPHDGAWLNFNLENGSVMFSWFAATRASHYRLRIFIEGVSYPSEVEVSPSDYVYAFGLATLAYRVNDISWDVLSDLGTLTWQVATIDAGDRSQTSLYSSYSTFQLAPTDCVTLRDPQDYSLIPSNRPPEFKWDADLNAAAYLVGFVKVSTDGLFYEETFSGEVPFYVNELPTTQQSWDFFTDGYWLWTVLALYDDGSYGNFMMFHFRKLSTL
ncbi:hypothetical protein JW905_08820 [bacterium]|nr:hypothetical protein [candidate division CSSED10-310 bacterium]